MMHRRTWFYMGFFALLLLLFYVALVSTSDFGKVKLQVLNSVRPFSFYRQDSAVVTEKDLLGKVYVAEYFFTTCKGICPRMNRNMKTLYDEFRKEQDFRILSHTVDPATDSVKRLRVYADSIGADVSNWWFLTGTKESLYKSARESYLLDDPANSSAKIQDQFLHTQFFALVDRQGRVRGVYDGLQKDEIKQLREDIVTILREGS